ncbi:MAG: hypothetical protein ABFS09_12900 [Thermodesulfobacteriota bacterium]
MEPRSLGGSQWGGNFDLHLYGGADQMISVARKTRCSPRNYKKKNNGAFRQEIEAQQVKDAVGAECSLFKQYCQQQS